MNRKLVAISGGSFALGALLSWAITADVLENKARLNRAAFRRVIEGQQKTIFDLHDGMFQGEPINKDALDEAHTHLLEDLQPQTLEIVTPIDETADAQELQAKLENDEVDEEEFEAIRSNLQNIIDEYAGSPESRDEFVEIASKRIKAEKNEPPFVIPVRLFAWDEDEGNDFLKTTLTFYSRERVLVDEDEEGIDHKDVDEYVGWKNLNRFGDQSDDPDVVYIRNRRLSTDFEVVRSDEKLPLHVQYGMRQEEYNLANAAGLIKFREE